MTSIPLKTKKVPWAWQIEAAAWGAAREIMSLVVDCGCGKTLAAIMIALKKALPVIVIAPTHTLCNQWKADIEEALGDGADVWVYNKNEETRKKDAYRERFTAWLAA
jgi:superfamily II DNA or RNA helicase